MRGFTSNMSTRHLLVVVVELANLGGNLANLPALEAKLGVQYLTVLLLKLPQLRVDVKGASKVRLPLLVAVLWKVSVRGKEKIVILY